MQDRLKRLTHCFGTGRYSVILSFSLVIAMSVEATEKANRNLPQGTSPKTGLEFSMKPTVQEIFRARVFEEPLVPIGSEPSAEENTAITATLPGYAKCSGPDDFASLTGFLEKYPQSPWRAALLTCLGLEYCNTAHYSLALGAWEKAWPLAKDATDLKRQSQRRSHGGRNGLVVRAAGTDERSGSAVEICRRVRNGTFGNFYYTSNAVTMQMSNTTTAVLVRVTDVLAIPPPHLLLPVISRPNIQLAWTTISNCTCRLELNPELASFTNWFILPSDVTAISKTASQLDALTSSNQPYRVCVLPRLWSRTCGYQSVYELECC